MVVVVVVVMMMMVVVVVVVVMMMMMMVIVENNFNLKKYHKLDYLIMYLFIYFDPKIKLRTKISYTVP